MTLNAGAKSITVSRTELSKGMSGFILNAIRNTAEYILVLLTILECNSLYLHYAGAEVYNEKLMRYGVLAMAVVLLILRFGEIRRNIKAIAGLCPYFIGLYTLMAVFLYFNVIKLTNLSSNFITAFMMFMPIMCLLFYLDRLSGKPYNILWKYENIILVYAALTFVIYLWVTLCPYKMPASTVSTHWSNKGNLLTYSNYFGITTIKNEKLFSLGNIIFQKNIGAFTEPPMAMIPLITALFAELFLKGRVSSWLKAVLLSVVVFTTGSTLGLMLVIFALVLKLIESIPDKYKLILVVGTLVIGCIGIAVLFFLKKKNDAGSFSVHLQDYVLSIKAFLQSPIFGNAYYSDEAVVALMSASRFKSNSGLSNSIALIAAQGGIILELICMTPFVLGIIRFFSKNKDVKRESLFFAGMFALYVVTIFHYRMFLMLLMAFGYSLFPLGIKNKTELDFSGVKRKGYRPWVMAGAVLLILSILSLGNLWKWIFAFFKSESLLLSQSSFNLIFSICFVIFFSEMLAQIIEGDKKANNIIFTFTVIASLLITLPLKAILFSRGQTLAELLNKGSLSVIAALAMELLPAAAVVLFVFSLLKLKDNKIYIIPLSIAVLVPLVTIFGSNYLISVKSEAFTEDIAKGETIIKLACQTGERVYSDILPDLYKAAYPDMSLSSSIGSDYAQLENATVLMTGNHKEMFDEGFMCTAVSGDHALYTNDTTVIETLKSNGYTLYNHYPNKTKTDLDALAAMSGISCNDSGKIEMTDESTSLLHGPYISLEDGTYSVTFSLRKDKSVKSGAVCTVRISSNSGQNVIRTKTANAEDFKENKLKLTLKIKAKDARNVEFIVYPYQKVSLSAITYKLSPSYDTVKYRDEYNRVVRIAYTKAGEPYTMKNGYAYLERDYDENCRVSAIRYYDKDSKPCITGSNYFEVKREYSSSGKLIKESYYDTEGNPVLCKSGYSAYTAEYAANGKVSCYTYFGLDGEPVINSKGYAQVRYEYGKYKKKTRISYYDTEGKLTDINKGYCEIKFTYNENWTKRISKIAYNTLGETVDID